MEEVTSKFDSMVKRIYLLPSLLGAFPLYYSGSQLSISVPLLSMSLLLKIALALQAILHLIDPPIITRGLSRFYKFFTISIFEYDFGVSCFFYAKIFATRKYTNRIIKAMRRSDVSVSKFCEIPDYRTNVLQDVMILLLMTFPTTIRFLQLKATDFPIAAEQFYLTSVNFSIYLSIVPFLSLVTLLKSRFLLLQRHLSETVVRSSGADKIELLALSHSDYCSIGFMLNDLFSEEILLVLTVGFLNTAVGSYKTITAYMIGQGLSVVAVKAFIIIEYLIITVVITTICESASDEAKEFNTLLYQLMIDDKTNDISNNKKLRLHIAMKREVAFTACGFFTLDYTLVHSMIAAATTYLVILIQFGQPTSSSSTTPSMPTNFTSFINTTETPQSITTVL